MTRRIVVKKKPIPPISIGIDRAEEGSDRTVVREVWGPDGGPPPELSMFDLTRGSRTPTAARYRESIDTMLADLAIPRGTTTGRGSSGSPQLSDIPRNSLASVVVSDVEVEYDFRTMSVRVGLGLVLNGAASGVTFSMPSEAIDHYISHGPIAAGPYGSLPTVIQREAIAALRSAIDAQVVSPLVAAIVDRVLGVNRR